jgi:hypothetical protein
MATKIFPCTCVNLHQDAIHGQGRRVFNKTAKENPIQYSCTVCSAIKSKDEPLVKKGKK